MTTIEAIKDRSTGIRGLLVPKAEAVLSVGAEIRNFLAKMPVWLVEGFTLERQVRRDLVFNRSCPHVLNAWDGTESAVDLRNSSQFDQSKTRTVKVTFKEVRSPKIPLAGWVEEPEIEVIKARAMTAAIEVEI